MNVARYLFQSPYSSPVQVGRPDTSVKKEESSGGGAELNLQSQSARDAQSFQATQIKEVQPTVDASQALLDVYA
ncbi:hypothetical protein KJ691_05195 [bacterium]|nr:hypothetical protein [bacterium]